MVNPYNRFRSHPPSPTSSDGDSSGYLFSPPPAPRSLRRSPGAHKGSQAAPSSPTKTKKPTSLREEEDSGVYSLSSGASISLEDISEDSAHFK